MYVEAPVSSFTRDNTFFAKGIAICLILFTHLLYGGDYTSTLFHSNFSQIFFKAFSGKLALTVFVILSGYGLYESLKRKPQNIRSFYRKRFSKLYINYWSVWLVFVPIGVFFFGRSFQDVYLKHIFFRLFINILGLQSIFCFPGYNITWWFISTIIVLYFIFPFLKTLVIKYRYFFLVICLFFPLVVEGALFRFLGTGINPVRAIRFWIFPFALGIYLSDVNGIARVSSYLSKPGWLKLMVYLLLLVCLAKLKLDYFPNNYRPAVAAAIDPFMALLLIQIGFEFVEKLKLAQLFFRYIGIHSLNIFLIHTFIFYYYTPQLIYGLKSPIFMFIALLGSSLIFSLILEQIKKWLRIDELYRKINALKPK